MIPLTWLLLVLTYAEAFNSDSFPQDFFFGVGTSAYQTEGAWDHNGKGPNIWDHHTHTDPTRIADQSNGDIACDSYHKFKEDVALAKSLGVNVFKISLAWSRILPGGFANAINQDGIRFYNELIDELIKNDIEPVVVLYHWDLPQVLQEFGGWLNVELVDVFADYARVAFENFGDRVRYWITNNEACNGYGDEHHAPAVNASGVADYLCYYVAALAHAKVYRLYEQEFRKDQNGKIGLTINTNWFEPTSSSSADVEAAERMLAFWYGHYLEPLLGKDPEGFPKTMRERIAFRSEKGGYSRSRLPTFSPEEVEFIQGTVDFIGANYYTTVLVGDAEEAPFDQTGYLNDVRVRLFRDPTWRGSEAPWLKVVPWGFRKSLNYLKKKYGNVEIIITENGYADDGRLEDTDRIEYLAEHLNELLEAIHKDEINVSGFIAWSLLDNFEWSVGYTQKFGLFRVDFDDPNRPRTPKLSSKFYRNVIETRRVTTDVPKDEL